MRNRRLHRAARGGAHPARGPRPARVPRLRLGRHRARHDATATCSSRSAPASWPTCAPRCSTPRPSAAVGLAHTRWATHGRPNDLNAHPHVDCTGEITVIHNGIIENFKELRDGLRERGHRSARRPTPRRSRTSSRRRTTGDIADAVRAALRQAHGAYAVAVLHAARAGAARRRAPERAAHRRPGRRRELPRLRRRRRARPHPPGDLPRGGRRGRPRPPTRSPSPASTASPRERPVHRHRLVDRGRREGRLRALHAQGDARAARGDPRGDRRPRPRRRRSSSTSWSRSRTRLATVDRVEFVACGTRQLRGGRRRLRSSRTGRTAGALEHRLRVPLQPAAARRAHARHRRDPVGRDGRHASRRRATPASRAARSSR